MKGLVFDIKEMAVYDGPGIRTTVFLKGCPLRCMWCHNPEGWSPEPQLMVSHASCLHCGKCVQACPNGTQGPCLVCGQCIGVCPLRLRRVVGTYYEAQDLAGQLLRNRAILENTGGGVTFSGGEPLLQSQFMLEVVSHLQGLHCAVETSGYASGDMFEAVIARMDHVIMDIKLVDDARHREFCGQGNAAILANLQRLKASGKPFTIRIPLIPGVNDTQENLEATARLLEHADHLKTVELLPYHQAAGAKYDMVFLKYAPSFDVDRAPNADCAPFLSRGIPCTVL